MKSHSGSCLYIHFFAKTISNDQFVILKPYVCHLGSICAIFAPRLAHPLVLFTAGVTPHSETTATVAPAVESTSWYLTTGYKYELHQKFNTFFDKSY